MLLGTSQPGLPGSNRDFPTRTVVDKEMAPEGETGIRSCSCTGSNSQAVVPRDQEGRYSKGSSKPNLCIVLPKVQLTALTTKPPCSHARNGHRHGKARGLGFILGSADTVLAHLLPQFSSGTNHGNIPIREGHHPLASVSPISQCSGQNVVLNICKMQIYKHRYKAQNLGKVFDVFARYFNEN